MFLDDEENLPVSVKNLLIDRCITVLHDARPINFFWFVTRLACQPERVAESSKHQMQHAAGSCFTAFTANTQKFAAAQRHHGLKAGILTSPNLR